MINKEKRLICAIMVFVLICLLFFSSVAFGQVSSPPLQDPNIIGTVFYSDGITPYSNPLGSKTIVELYHNGTQVNETVLSSSGQYNFTNVSGDSGPYYVVTTETWNKTDSNVTMVTRSSPFNVIQETTVMNLTTNRMLTN